MAKKSVRKISKKGNVKKEFVNFADKISKLESLRHELDTLNTRGFKTEVKLIRSKLRDVNAIPEIKRDIDSLRLKIKRNLSKGVLKSKIAKKLLEQSSNLQEDRKLMKRKIAELEGNLTKKRQISKKEFGIAKELLKKSSSLQRNRQGFLKDKIIELEEKVSRKRRLSEKEIEDKRLMEEKIAELEEKVSRKKQLSKKEVEDIKSIAKLKGIAKRKQLSKEEVGEIKGIPELENQLKDLKKDFEEHTKASKVKIDTGVGVLIDSKYDDFINEIKAELTERLEAKEMVISNKLKANLKEQKERFAEQYTTLTNEFHQKYKEKVKEELKKDVKEKFKHILERKLAIERNKITDSLIKEHANKLHDDRKKIIVKLESDYEIKQKKLKENLNKEKNLLAVKQKKLEENLGEKKNLLKSKIESVENEKKNLLEKEKNFNNYKIKIEKEFSDKIKVIKEKMYTILVSKLQGIRKDSGNKIKKKEEEFKSQFEKKYKEELKKAIAIKEKQLDMKKAELERDVMQHAKKLFG